MRMKYRKVIFNIEEEQHYGLDDFCDKFKKGSKNIERSIVIRYLLQNLIKLSDEKKQQLAERLYE